MVTYEDVAPATAAQASLGAALAPRIGRTVGVNFCAFVPAKVRQSLEFVVHHPRPNRSCRVPSQNNLEHHRRSMQSVPAEVDVLPTQASQGQLKTLNIDTCLKRTQDTPYRLAGGALVPRPG